MGTGNWGPVTKTKIPSYSIRYRDEI